MEKILTDFKLFSQICVGADERRTSDVCVLMFISFNDLDLTTSELNSYLVFSFLDIIRVSWIDTFMTLSWRRRRILYDNK